MENLLIIRKSSCPNGGVLTRQHHPGALGPAPDPVPYPPGRLPPRRTDAHPGNPSAAHPPVPGVWPAAWWPPPGAGWTNGAKNSFLGISRRGSSGPKPGRQHPPGCSTAGQRLSRRVRSMSMSWWPTAVTALMSSCSVRPSVTWLETWYRFPSASEPSP